MKKAEKYIQAIAERFFDDPEVETVLILADNITVKFKDGSMLKMETLKRNMLYHLAKSILL